MLEKGDPDCFAQGNTSQWHGLEKLTWLELF